MGSFDNGVITGKIVTKKKKLVHTLDERICYAQGAESCLERPVFLSERKSS